MQGLVLRIVLYSDLKSIITFMDGNLD